MTSDESPSADVSRSCIRCGDDVEHDRGSRLCDSCEKEVQTSKLLDGVQCERCNGHGRISGTYCDVQRAMKGRDQVCPVCDGSGRVPWRPDPEDVHPDLRAEVKIRAQ